MRQLGAITHDDFNASIEYIRYGKAVQDDIYTALSSLIGNATVFISGGTITTVGGNTTVTNGIIHKDGKLYTFIGGTFAGSPTGLKVKFTNPTASGFPIPYFGSTPIDVYKSNIAVIDATGTVSLPDIESVFNFNICKNEIAIIKSNFIKKESDWIVINAQSPFTGSLLALKTTLGYKFHFTVGISSAIAKGTTIAITDKLSVIPFALKGVVYSLSSSMLVDIMAMRLGGSNTHIVIDTAIPSGYTHLYFEASI